MNTRHTTLTGIATATTAFAAAAAVCQDVGYFATPSAGSAALFAGLAAVAGAFAGPLPDLRTWSAKLVAPAIGVALWALGMPALAALGLIAWGLLAFAPRHAALVRLRSGAGLAGALLLLGHLALPYLVRLELAAPSLAPLATLGAGLLELFGRDATAAGAVVYLGGRAGGEALLLDPFKLGGLFAALGALFTGLLAWRGSVLRGLAASAGVLAFVAAFGLVRLLVLAGMPELFGLYEVLLAPTTVYLSYVPCVLLLGALVARWQPAQEEPVQAEAAAPTWRAVPTFAAAAIGIPCLAAAVTYHETGELRDGRVVMDESHGRWEASDVPFDTNSWGRGSTYNYAEFASLLDRHFAFDVNRDGPITRELLADTQVVVLKTPSSPYTPAELDALHEFVSAGGGIWLIGDHTNLYGMSDSLNPIAGWAGMEFRKDAVYDATSGQTTYNETTVRFHPTAVASDPLAYQTSCSLAITGPGVEPVLMGWRGTGEFADYGHPNFFGDLTTDYVDRSGLMLQAAVGSVGKGKVAAFTDSTIFSNFSIFDPGVSELVLRTVQSLRYTEPMPKGWRGALLALGIALSGAAALGSRRRLTGGLPLGASAFGLALVLVGRATDATTDDLYAPPAPTDPYRQIAFLDGPSSFIRTSFVEEASEGPVDEHAGHGHAAELEPMAESSLSTFMTWALRVDDARPRLATTVADAIEGGADMIVLFDPVEAPTHEDGILISRFVQHGGVFLVLDDLLNVRSSTTNEWLQPFELEVELVRGTGELFEPRPTAQMGLTRTVGALAGPELVLSALMLQEPRAAAPVGVTYSGTRLVAKGGSALFLDETGEAISAMTQLGAGRAGVFARSSALTNDALGGRFDLDPAPDMLARHLFAVSVLESFLDFSTLPASRAE